MWVIKIGGSLQHAGNLPEFLKLLVDHASGQAVIVPGGGDYADQVRQLQANQGLDEKAAHCMALRAMEKFGDFLMTCEPRLKPARSFDEIKRLLATRVMPVWFPYDTVADKSYIPASWDITSDTLALWCAEQLRCQHLFLLKAAEPGSVEYSARNLSQCGFLDRGFVDMTKKTHVASWWLHYGQTPSFFRMLERREHPATFMNQITLGARCASH